jgi:hypothetical protein
MLLTLMSRFSPMLQMVICLIRLLLGSYDINATATLTDKYFYTYQNGSLIVSNKLEQELIFDQNLSDIPATMPSLPVKWLFRKAKDGNLTQLPLNYSVEDESVARILVTRQDALTGILEIR